MLSFLDENGNEAVLHMRKSVMSCRGSDKHE